MSQPENLGSFIKQNKEVISEYVENRIDLLKLQAIRSSSKAIGYFIWILVSMFLLFGVFIFIGIVIGFWLTDVTGSLVKGFGFATLILAGIVALLALFRKSFFVNPVIKTVIAKLQEDDATEDDNN